MLHRYLPVALALVLFGLPLFIGLGGSDLENDEAIYSYSVERMLALHDWMTPRGIYDGADNPFLEKPPLKTWIVAAGQAAGLPRDEFGLRFFDPAFGVLAFLYVFAFGRRLAGPLCGFVALLVLFTFQPLVFEHGLRTNNMEAALLLTYCGGLYHVVRWVEDQPAERRRHAWIAAGFFAFGFLVKFVAALFLPLVAVVAIGWRRDAVPKMRDAAREWLGPGVAALALVAPWFLYQTAIRGAGFWNEIFGHQVFARFTAFLDPNHVRPWHYYVVQTWLAFAQSGEILLVVAGVLWLATRAWQDRPWLARVLLVWWIVPLAAISAATSKLPHYGYPFIPPLALGAGAAAASWIDFWNARSREWRRPLLRGVAGAAALVLLLLAAWIAETGPFTLRLAGLRVLRSGPATWPLLLGLLALGATGSIRSMIRLAAIVLLAIALPVPAYVAGLQKLREPHFPLRAIRDCAAELAPPGSRAGAAGPGWIVAGHSFFYYLRSLGPYRELQGDDDVRTRIFTPGSQTPVVVDRRHVTPQTSWQLLSAIDFGPFALVLPGPYDACTASAVAAGGRRFEFAPAPR